MKTAVVNFKTTPEIKKRAQINAKTAGISLSVLLNQELRRIAQAKNLEEELEPSEWLIQQLKESAEDEKASRVHSFATPEESIAFLRSLRNKK